MVDALTGLKYDTYKGPQFYRACDHQSVQSVLIIESKSKDMRNPSDVFRVPYTVPGSDSLLRSCSELGYKS